MMLHPNTARFRALVELFVPVACLLAATASGQIGDYLPSQGPFVLDDFEDLDLEADSVGRTWVVSAGDGMIAGAANLGGLTLVPGQTPNGALHLSAEARFNFLDASAGVPIPSTKGASTLTDPGDISGFRYLTFLACHSSVPADASFQVILECYPQNPDSTFPKMYWNFAPTSGNAYQPIVIELYQPTLVESNPQDRSVAELLSQTRFLAFYMFAAPVSAGVEMTLHLDDITLEGVMTFASMTWELYE